MNETTYTCKNCGMQGNQDFKQPHADAYPNHTQWDHTTEETT